MTSESNKLIVTLLFLGYLLSMTPLYSQYKGVTVDYKVRTNKDNQILSTELVYRLIHNGNESSYWNVEEGPQQYLYGPKDPSTQKVGDFTTFYLNDNTMGLIIQDKLYKNYPENKLIYNESQGSKLIVIEEPVQIINWTIIPKSDTTILGFICQKANATFRGRQYEAFFSPQLFHNGGPWKFDGLPGLILAVKSIDNYFVVTPLKIVTAISGTMAIRNPYEKRNDLISWKQFCESEKIKLEKLLKYMQSQSGPGETTTINVSDRIEDIGFKVLTK